MKKSLYILSAFAAVISCAPQELTSPQDVPYGSEISLNASFEDIQTKTTLVGRTKVYWVPGDEIKVFAGSSSARFSTDIDDIYTTCRFTGNVAAADKYYALYPFMEDASFDGKVIKATVPAVQTAKEGNVSNGLLFSAGVSSKNGDILFRNLLSGVSFTLKSGDVKYVELKGNGGEMIAGGINVSIDDNSVKTEASGSGDTVIRLLPPGGGTFTPGAQYYIMCIPNVFKKGLTLEMTNSEDCVATLSIDRPIELNRSTFGFRALADDGLVYAGGGFPEGEVPPDNEIWYTTLATKPVPARINDQAGQTLVSHTFNKGLGVLRFSGPVTSFDGLMYPYDSATSNDSFRMSGLLLPDCVEYIGEGIFNYFREIREFRIPAALKEAGGSAFTNLFGPSLERFTGHHVTDDGRCVIIDGVLYGFAPVGVTSYEIPSGVRKLQAGVCANSTELKSMVLPDGLEVIDDACFYRSGLESVTIPASVHTMAHYAFMNCDNLRNLLGDSQFISPDRKFLFDPHYIMLPNIIVFFAGKDDTSYTIPDWIRGIDNYSFINCKKLRSLTLPDSIEGVGFTAFDGCDNLEALYGKNISSDHKGILSAKKELLYLLPTIDADYVIPDEVTALGENLFASRQNLHSVWMGDQVTTIGSHAFSYCHSLKSVTLSANLVRFTGYNAFEACDALESVYVRSVVPPSNPDPSYTINPGLKVYVPSGSYTLYSRSADWKKYATVMEPYDYTDLPEPGFYISSDYSAEGEVTVYQKASEGRGIDLVLMGDAYTDKDVASGKYRRDMESCVEQYFAVEPQKSFRNLYNIYFVTAVSATEGYEHGGQSLGTDMAAGTQVIGNDPKCFELARLAVPDEERMQEVLVLICVNQADDCPKRYGGTCYMYDPDDWAGSTYGRGPSLVYFTKLDDSFENTGYVLRHECGHGFGKLHDEYYYPGSIYREEKERLTTYSAYGWYANVDLTSDPSKVKWSVFLSDERYKYDELGVYEGGATFQYGVWRPSLNSIMNDNTGRFNAPSRYAIWYRLHKLAYGDSWNGSFEDFVAYDAINRKGAPAGSKPKANKVELQQQRLHPPVATGRTWREAVRH